MGRKVVIAQGEKFNNLTFIKFLPSNYTYGTSMRFALCKCDCGVEKSFLLKTLLSGGTKSCGCLKKKKATDNLKKAENTTHGMSKTKMYHVWSMIKQRCYNPKCKNYNNYGARGIKISARWKNSFEAFLCDMGVPAKGMTIERVDTLGDYNKDNCKWATVKEQSMNKRNTNIYNIHGISFERLQDAALYFNKGKSTIRYWCKIKDDCNSVKKYV